MFKRDERKQKFYTSRAWRRLREEIITSKYGLCEICGEQGREVHHKKPIISELLDNQEHLEKIALSKDNLQLLCEGCHNSIRANITREGLRLVNGELVCIKQKVNY